MTLFWWLALLAVVTGIVFGAIAWAVWPRTEPQDEDFV